MERTQGRLSDGREIFWYDQPGTGRVPSVDERGLERGSGVGQLRRDPLTGDWIALATARQKRTFMPSAADCPLCPSGNGRHSEVPSSEYDVVVFENRFPALGGGTADTSGRTLGDHPVSELQVAEPAIGRCEVVCFSSDHDGTFATLTPEHARLVVDAWADRTAELQQRADVEFVYLFENRGVEIGVTLQHPHGQLYAYPFVPPRAALELRRAREYADATGRSLFGDIVQSELAGERVVLADEHWVAFVPFAARWPMEVHFYPRERVNGMPDLNDAQRDSFADIYLKVLRAFDSMYDARLPYIAAWQQSPATLDRDVAWLHLELFSIRRSADKLKYLAGTESGQGAFSCDVAPDVQAQTLRDLIGAQ